jgi:multisubunit Na+/H+ antiporter MnhF subunit
MIGVASTICLFCLAGVIAATLYRILVGPSVADRVAATDLLTTTIIAVVLVFGLRAHTRNYIDIVMVMAALGFFGTVALAKYVVGGRAID